ncbi:MAG: WYL domain-containing protein [Sulfuricellaceae bacterium]
MLQLSDRVLIKTSVLPIREKRVTSKATSQLLRKTPRTQRERLAYLEMRAYFSGELRRSDIESRFGIKPAAATRDLSAYRELAPDNLEYDAGTRCYRPGPKFSALFEFSAERVLSWLLLGFGDGLDLRLRKTVPCEGPSSLVNPDMEILAAITRALCAQKPLRVTYLSLATGAASRVIIPIALADNGLRWHVRAYDREKARFGDFVLTRITKAKVLGETTSESELLMADTQWARIVDLELVPHPGITHSETVEADYGMENGMLILQTRAALAGYALRRWSVDCSPDHRLPSNEHHLWLRNTPTLYGVESAVMAPGYTEG